MAGRARVVTIGLLWTSCAVTLTGHLAWHVRNTPWTGDLPALTATLLAFATVGAVVVLRRPGTVVGWLFVAVSALPASQMVAQTFARQAADAGGVSGLALAAAWFASVAWYPFFVLLMVVVPLLFPDGRLPSPRWRPVGWASAGCVVLGLAHAGAPGPLSIADGEPFPASNPLGVQALGPVVGFAGAVFFPLVMLLSVVAVSSLVVRFRRARGQERLQVTWVLLAVVVFLVALVVDEVLLDVVSLGAFVDGVLSDVVTTSALAGVPIAAGVAVLQYRLYDIDVVLNRVVVYTALAAAVTGGYTALLLVAGALAGDAGGPLLGLVAVAVAAVAFQPARARLQRAVNRLSYGDREDPFTAMTRLSARLENTAAPGAVLAAAAETLAHALRFPFVGIDVVEDDVLTQVASHGQKTAGPQHQVDLQHQGRTVGRLRFSLGGDEPALSARHRRRVDDIARQLVPTVQAARLTRELQRSRERLVSTREEERRRLRRDLHDGVGATLTGVALKLDALAQSVLLAPQTAQRLADEVISDTETALGELRRLVYGLRPPSLDELGLVGALRDHVDRLQGADVARVHLRVGDVPPLPAAVEVAVYRVVTEALTNVRRHAGARTCVVTLHLDGSLRVEVLDDGRGVPVPCPAGVGVASMRERAAELGGACTITAAEPRGTRVLLTLPVTS